MVWIGGAGLPDDVIRSVDLIMPWTSVPMITAHKVKDARPADIETNVKIIRQLIEEMAGISALVSAAPIISAAHISPHSDALTRPAVPLSVRIEAHWNDRGRGRVAERSAEKGLEDSHERTNPKGDQ